MAFNIWFSMLCNEDDGNGDTDMTW